MRSHKARLVGFRRGKSLVRLLHLQFQRDGSFLGRNRYRHRGPAVRRRPYGNVTCACRCGHRNRRSRFVGVFLLSVFLVSLRLRSSTPVSRTSGPLNVRVVALQRGRGDHIKVPHTRSGFGFFRGGIHRRRHSLVDALLCERSPRNLARFRLRSLRYALCFGLARALAFDFCLGLRFGRGLHFRFDLGFNLLFHLRRR